MTRFDGGLRLRAGVLVGLMVVAACGGRSTSFRDQHAPSSGSAGDGRDVALGGSAGGGATRGGGPSSSAPGAGVSGTGGDGFGGTTQVIPAGGGTGGGVRISLDGSGAANGAFDPAASLLAECRELCEREPTGCAAGGNQQLCLDRCAPLAQELPGCEPELAGYADCLVNERARVHAGDCSYRAEGDCNEPFEAIQQCAALCDESEFVDEDSCHYTQRCPGGDYASYCSRLEPGSTSWTCTCFAHGAWQGEQNLTAAPGEDACLLTWCEFILPPG